MITRSLHYAEAMDAHTFTAYRCSSRKLPKFVLADADIYRSFGLALAFPPSCGETHPPRFGFADL